MFGYSQVTVRDNIQLVLLHRQILSYRESNNCPDYCTYKELHSNVVFMLFWFWFLNPEWFVT